MQQKSKGKLIRVVILLSFMMIGKAKKPIDLVLARAAWGSEETRRSFNRWGQTRVCHFLSPLLVIVYS